MLYYLSMATPNYILTERVQYSWSLDDAFLEAGTFVRPIANCYLPPHVFDRDGSRKYIYSDTGVFYYTPKGIIPLPEDKVRKL